jgi:hypothetical protein
MGRLSVRTNAKVATYAVSGLMVAGATYERALPLPAHLIPHTPLLLAFLGVTALVAKVWCVKLKEDGRTRRKELECELQKVRSESEARLRDAVHETAEVSSDKDRMAEKRDSRRKAAETLTSCALDETGASWSGRPAGGPGSAASGPKAVRPVEDLPGESRQAG